VLNSQASNIFIARLQLGASSSATMMSSIILVLAGQSSARTEAAARDKTAARQTVQGFKRIALPIQMHLGAAPAERGSKAHP
jgi:hypothetical protein